MSIGVSMAIAIALLIANAFFVAVEFALVATKRAQIEERAESGNRRAVAALRAITDLNTQIAGAQLGITLCTIALGRIAEPSLAKLLENTVLSGIGEGARHTVGLIIALVFVTFLHILLGEMVPKNVALADAPRTTMWLSPLHAWFVRIAGPLVWMLNAMSNGVLRLIGVQPIDESDEAKTPEELSVLLKEAHHEDVLDENDFTLLSNTLELGEQSIRHAMVPWAQVYTADASASVRAIEASMARSGHSRLALLDPDAQPIGWVHAKDLLAVDSAVWDEPLPVGGQRDLLRFDVDTGVEDALEKMQLEQQHFALATNAGDLVGVITLEDVLRILVSGLAEAADDLAEIETHSVND